MNKKIRFNDSYGWTQGLGGGTTIIEDEQEDYEEECSYWRWTRSRSISAPIVEDK